MGERSISPFDPPEDECSVGPPPPPAASGDPSAASGDPSAAGPPNYGNMTRAWFDGGELAAHLEAGHRAERRRLILAVVASAALVVGTIVLLVFLE